MATWELVTNNTVGDSNLRLERLNVPGGWEIRYLITSPITNNFLFRTFSFIEDVLHLWILTDITAWELLQTEIVGIDTIKTERLVLTALGGWLVREYGISSNNNFIFQLQFSFLDDSSNIWTFTDWESVTIDLINGYNIFTDRLNIPGGWYIRNIFSRDLTDNFSGAQLSFLDDASHTWTL